ncbi:hypothetical protein OAL15_03860 [Flavobacteriales bacterium]|nr:hypothetical protein [Flavobacteriales bacterium]
MEYIKLGFVFAAFGCFFEVFFTAVYDSIEHCIKKGRKTIDVRFFGYWSILYTLIYGVLLPVFWVNVVVPYIYDLHLGIRTFVYGVSFQVGEYISMYILHVIFGQSPSEAHYRGKFDSIHNFTRLTYFPAFCLAGLIFELIYEWYLI